MEMTNFGIIAYCILIIPYALITIGVSVHGRTTQYRELIEKPIAELIAAAKETPTPTLWLMVVYNFAYLAVAGWNVIGLLTTNWPFHIAFIVIQGVGYWASTALGKQNLEKSRYMAELGHAILTGIVATYAMLSATGAFGW